jgi:WS/DGAT/MGAT family acyltransferase
MGFYERLSELDHSFLIYEAQGAPMHVAATQIYEAGPLRGPDGCIEIEKIQSYVLSRLHLIPRYRQRLAYTPIRRHPVWVDDDRFNIRYHVRHSRLPRPGSERQLKRTAARIFSQQLDLAKPLWEMWVIEGVEGDRVAIVSKTHHCMIDGISGTDLMSVLMTPEPMEKIEHPPAWVPRPAPTALELARGEAWRSASTPLQVAQGAARLIRDEGARHDTAERLRATGRLLAGGVSGASPTPLNQPIGPYRRFDWWSQSLDEIRAVRHKLGGTVNDVVLATTAGAVRRFLQRSRQVDVDGLDFRVMAPVSVRSDDERGALGNRVSAWIVPLPIAERDPRRRLERICEITHELKEQKQALGAETLSGVLEWTGPTLLSLGARLMTLGTPFNMVVTNVPGPRLPLHLLESRMLAAHAMLPLMGTLASGIALFSYAGQLSWGVIGDWDLVPDLHDFAVAVEHSFEELKSA